MKKRSRKPNTASSGDTNRTKVSLLWVTTLVLGALVLGMVFVDVVVRNLGLEERDTAFGATFSMHYAEELGLDWEEAYLATLDELGVRRLRLPAYWDVIEPEDGEFDFSIIDWQLEEAEKRGASVILAIGRKLPRWPECHVPEWAEDLEEEVVRDRIIRMLEEVVRHYEGNQTIVVWQVENEPLFPFGECPPPDRDFLKHEIATVRAHDDRPVMLTESGELSTWVRTAGLADVLGISTYRAVWNRWIGHFYWPITPRNYARRAAAIAGFVDQVIVSELQAEPWSPGPITMEPIPQQLDLMSVDHLRDNVSFAKRIGLPQVYLWGVEWWYWLDAQGYPELWQEGQRIFRSPMTEGKEL